ncbi:DMT family transporter [Paracoccus sediminicola]|uniref:DMT family transporter n=1 Tax=Paracoccus sediminicola TaxID=3017783 RepID=UPI0022F0AA89|nr:DMT family transporter [Paracoccus sediminicola]WBU56779.1 DMT family transporter [Paracoccus sediminicola]
MTGKNRSAQSLGIAAMCAAMFMLPMGDALTKLITRVLHPTDVTAIRSVIQLAALGLAALALRKLLSGRSLSWLSLASGLLNAVISLSLITAFKFMPIATAIAIFFVEPLLLTILAGPFLGERPGPRRYVAVAVGMIGTLIILRPNFSEFGWVVALPLIAALAFAFNMIVTRKATRHSSPLSFQIGASLFGASALVAISLLQPAEAVGPLAALSAAPGWVLIGLVASGALAALSFLTLTYAFAQAEASVLAPFQYLEILGATLVGYVVFGDGLDGLTLLGTLIVLGSGLYVIHRERRAEQDIRITPARADR